MKIMGRDIELMGWILEQKFMTREQVRKVFWKDLSPKSTEDYRRLYELMKADLLKRNRYGFYKHILYMVTGKGVKELRAFGRNKGLCELADLDYSNYKHDLLVTEIRMLFHKWGYTDWLSERTLAKSQDLRRLPDGMIHHQGKNIAVEYESSQKSKDRYREIFFHYELDEKIDQVLYVVDSLSLMNKLVQEAATCDKIYFLTLKDLFQFQMNTPVKGLWGQVCLHELMEKRE